MSAVLDKVCPFCGRPELLWGGDTCDVCDSDSNGINDRDEPASIPTTVDRHLLFGPDETGWVMSPYLGVSHTVIPEWRRLSDEMRLRVLARRRLNRCN